MKPELETSSDKKQPDRSDLADRSSPGQKWWTGVIQAVLFTALAVLILEGVLKASGAGQQQFLKPDSGLGCVHIPGKKVVWRMEGYSSESLNSRGYRDIEHALSKPHGVMRIALIGDSMTEGLQVPLEATFARQLDHLLNDSGAGRFEVLNFGCSSYSTGQEYLLFREEVKKYRPDVTVLLYGRGDSLENVRNPGKSRVEPRPYFYLDEAGNLKTDRLVLNAKYPRGFEKTAGARIDEYLREHSAIYGVLSQADLSLSIHERIYRKLRSWMFSIAEFATGSGRRSSTVAQYAMPDAWKVTEAIIKSLNRDCVSAGSHLIVMVSPNTVGDVQLGWQAAQLELLSRKEGFGVLDLTEAFSKQSDVNSLFYDVHFTRSGHALVASEIKRHLDQSGLMNAAGGKPAN